ncbi:MAG: phenylalanine--tRNA ligase subunit alpha [Mycoplasmataceae bacterium]|nr:phenylalanine--tRNA ligase subunit alpha [Mycoplasmataceae bacterium]
MKQIDTKKIIQELKDKLSKNLNETQIIELRNVYVNKYVSPIYQELKTAPNAEKKEIGNFVNIFKNEINELINDVLKKLKQEKENSLHKVDYDINIDNVNLTKGGLTPLTLITNEILSFFRKLDFQVIDGSEVVQTKYNFDNLNIDVSHPARSYQDSFFINSSTMLRTHCTATTAEALDNNKCSDIRVVTYGNVYRNDEDDATHSHQFNQVDILWAKDGLNLQNLKWLISSFLKHLFGDKVQARFRLSYFPFTEPSFEVDMTCTNCHGKGCPMCKHTGWIEILGAGMLHENVMKAANVNIKTVLAAGIGIDRLAILKYGFSDIRDLYNNDFRVLNQFKKVF